MPLRIRYQYPTGTSLGYSIERLRDGAFLDFSDSTFKPTPMSLIASLPEDIGSFSGRYKTTLTPTPVSQFTDGDYVVTVHNGGSANVAVAQLAVVMHAGDDSTVLQGGTAPDPWASPLPGAYSPGTAGAILGGNLDAKVSTRSTYAGGPVASVTSPVIIGSNNDKSGYMLAPTGLDAVPVESGVNVRQALSPILAASAGALLGAGTGTIVVKGGNVATTRITASTDNAGNRTAVVLSLPN